MAVDTPSRGDACLVCLSERIRGAISRGFVLYSSFLAGRPWAGLLLGCLFLLLCAPGLAVLELRNDPSQFWMRGSYGERAHARVSEHFSNPVESGTQVYFVAEEGRSLMETGVLLDVGRAVDRVLGVKTSAGEGFADVCEKSWRGHCEVDSVFHQFREAGPRLGVNLTTLPGVGEAEGLALQLARFCNSSRSACGAFLGSLEGDFVGRSPRASGPAAGSSDVASLLVMIYTDPHREDASGELSSRAFQEAVMDFIHAPGYKAFGDNLRTDAFYTLNYSEATTLAEGDRPASHESHLMCIAFVLILLFVASSIYAPARPRSRLCLALSCMLTVGLSMACALGLGGYLGVPLTSVTTLVCFTLFGVSVDDIIVIVHAYDRLPGTAADGEVSKRIAQSLLESGPAIALTSTTSLVAFLVSALCPIPNVSYFCLTAGFGIAATFVLQMTLFLPLFILDERRRLAGYRDCCLTPCLGPLPKYDSADGEVTGCCTTAADIATVPSVRGGCGVVDKLARFLSAHRTVQAVVVLLFLAVAGTSAWGLSKADSHADLSEYYIDTSFMKEVFRMRKRLWEAKNPYFLVIEHQDEGLFSDDRLADIGTLFGDLAALNFTSGPQKNWLSDFEAYLRRRHDPADLAAERARLRGDARAFGARVAEFLEASPFEVAAGHVVVPWRHKPHVAMRGGVVKWSRLVLSYESDPHDQERYIDNFHRSFGLVFPRGDGGSFEGPRVPHTFGYTAMYPVAERDERMTRIIFENLATACGAVALTVMVMLDPYIGFFVGVLMVAMDTIVLALLTLYGSKLDFVAFLCLSMTIGLVVDYSTHTAHAYLHSDGSLDEKLYRSVSQMGASVLSGGCSTVLGITVLAFASSEAFRDFFRVLGTAITVGTAVGVLVSPVLLRVLHGACLRLLQALRSSRLCRCMSRSP